MSPTLLELLVAILLVCVAWRIGVWLAPIVFASFRRNMNPPREPEHWPPEKNVTPPASRRSPSSPQTHGPK